MSYDIDTEYDSWLNEQIKLLKNQDFKHLDVPNLIEELEALVREEKSAVESFAYQIMLHLLLIDYWREESEWNRRHWRSEVYAFQLQLSSKLTTNFKNYLETNLDLLYTKARKGAILKTGLTSDGFPEKRVYSLNQVLGEQMS